MARRNRSNGLELNFDGLADSVTNLVGALILLVVMIIGVSKDAVSEPPPPPPSAPQPGEREKPILPLAERIALLEAEVRQVDASISQLHERLEPLREEVDELLDKVDSLQPPPNKPEEKPRDRVTKEIPFRPPFERLDVDRRSVSFVVEDGRVSLLDMEEVGKQVGKALAGRSGVVSINTDLPGSDFRIEGKVSATMAQLKVVRRPGATGESLAEAERDGSRFRQTISRLAANEAIVNFDVYPDSFETFRGLRQITWDKQFDLGWQPMKSGQLIELVRGVGVGSTQ